jgi:hypothetical protein
LTASGDYGDANQLFEHIRIAALAAPAEDSGMDAEWAGYWISRDTDDDPVYADSRYAPPGLWTPMSTEADTAETNGEPESVETAAVDLTEQHYDEESGRWRRWNADDSEFEYYHDTDGVWERLRDGTSYRYHDVAEEWLAYDAGSGTWWYEDDWRPFDDVGTTPEPTEPPAPEMAAEPAPAAEEAEAEVRAAEGAADGDDEQPKSEPAAVVYTPASDEQLEQLGVSQVDLDAAANQIDQLLASLGETD